MEGKKEGLEEEKEPRSERYGLWGHPYMTPAQMLRYLTPLSLCLHPQIRIFHISPLVWTSYMYGPLLRVIVPQPSQSRARIAPTFSGGGAEQAKLSLEIVCMGWD